MAEQDSRIAIVRSMGGLWFDAVMSEKHTSETAITENPVETGVSVSDHAYMKPLTLSIDAVVSNAPLHLRSNDQFGGQGADRVRTAWEMLGQLQVKREPFDVVTGLKVYKNMMVTKLETTQDKDSSNVLNLKCELREVIIVSTQVVKYPPRAAGATARQGAKTANKGTVEGKDVAADKKGSAFTKLKSFIAK